MNKDNLLNVCQGLVDELTEVYKNWDGVAQFKNTPMRLTRMYEEFCWSPGEIRV